MRYPDGRVFFSGLVQSTYQIDYNAIEFRRGVFFCVRQMSFIFGLLKKNPNWILRIYSFHDMWMCILGFVFCKNECDFPVFDAVISFQFPFLCSSVSFSSCLFCYFHPFTSRHSCLPVVKLNSGKRADAFILSNLFENWQKKTQKTFTSKDFVLCWWNGPNCELNIGRWIP